MTGSAADSRKDFATDGRLLWITAAAAAVGILSTLAARALLLLIRLFTNVFFFHAWSVAATSPAGNTWDCGWSRYRSSGGCRRTDGSLRLQGIRGHGIPEAIEAILFGESRMSLKVAILKPLSSGHLNRHGGPFGAEGPIIMTGGAMGSLIGQFLRLSGGGAQDTAGGRRSCRNDRHIRHARSPRYCWPSNCCCSNGAPAACPGRWPRGRPSALPRLCSAPGPLFPFAGAAVTARWRPGRLPRRRDRGRAASALYQALYSVEDAFGRLPIHWMWWPALGGIVVGVGGYLQPRALGVGYDVIGDLLQNHLALQVALALLLCKAVMWVVALGSGTSGGVLAPLLMLGAGLGVVLGPLLPGATPLLWPLVFMAATLGGMMRAPIMALMFAFEVTHDVNALLPLLTACATAYGFTVLLMPRSILTEKIARRGYHIYREYGIDPLERHVVSEVMTREVATIDAATSITEALASHFGAHQRHRAFPVVRAGRFLGMVDRTLLVRHVEVSAALAVGDLFGENPPVVALPGETCRIVATRLAVHHLERLPVVENADSRRLLGLIARSDLVKPSLALFDEEHHYERAGATPWTLLKQAFRRP